MERFTRLSIPELLIAQMIGHARAADPVECCGLLAGTITDGVGVARERFGVRNDADSPTAYRTNADDLLAAFRLIRAEGLELLAVYHSHPAGEPVPSRRDVAENTYGETVAHVIVGLAERPARVRVWWLTEAGYREAGMETLSGK